IIYQRTGSWGFGPGGNETGVVVYTLSDQSAVALQSRPQVFLRQLHFRDRCWDDNAWSETPIIANDTNPDVGTVAGTPLTLAQDLNHYGFGIPIDRGVSSMIDRAYAEPGSYYALAHCGGGMFIIMPKAHRAAFIYVG